MKLASYNISGKDSYGVVVDGGIIDLGSRIGGQFADIKALIAGNGLNAAAKAAEGQKPDHALDAVNYNPVVPNAEKIICVGLNYKTHREETGRAPTDNPALFIRFADTQTGHNQPLVLPKASSMLDYEGELAVIIGKGGRHVKAKDALSIVAGYSIYNDGSVRDFQNHTHQWAPGKNFPKTGGFGPWMVTADEIDDPQALEIKTILNGETLQSSNTKNMIFDTRTIIAYVSNLVPLQPGDVIATGTPEGVGMSRDPQVWMQPGDTCIVEIEKVGRLVNPIAEG